MINRAYGVQRSFLLDLEGEQKALFEELLSFGFESADMTARYFCLRDEEYLPQRKLAVEYGYPERMYAWVSARILSVLHYLDPSFEVGEGAMRSARALRERVSRLREKLQDDTDHLRLVETFFATYGMRLAPNFPLYRLEILEEVLKAKANGQLERLRMRDKVDYQALALRFGLDQPEGGIYRTLNEVGQLLNVTRERARQREERALAWLGIGAEQNLEAD